MEFAHPYEGIWLVFGWYLVIDYDGFKNSDVLPPGLADLCCCIELHQVTPFSWVKQHSLGLLANLMIFIPQGSVALSHPHKKHMYCSLSISFRIGGY